MTQGNGSNISTKLQWIAELAKRKPGEALTTLSHHMDMEFMKEAYRRTRKDGAVGIDGQTALDYARDLEKNLRSLLERAKSGRYRAPAVRRVRIPKGKGKETRPIGIPTFEDKILQRAVSMILEAIYEQEFADGSYGFRPGRSAHQALEALWKGLMDMRGGWVLEIDIRKFFDTLDKKELLKMLRRRVRDGVILRLIAKWLNAGVMEKGELTYPETGTPQGGVISPILANIYLHEVLDMWFKEKVLPRMRGKAFLIRYADDATLVFEQEYDARRVLESLPKRFRRFKLTLHPEKTRLVDFRRPPKNGPGQSNGGGKSPRSFDLLGFTHYWSLSRRGFWVVKRKTAKDRFSRGLRNIKEWCRKNRHNFLYLQHRDLSRKLKGHFAYFGITGNSKALTRFRHEVVKIWKKWLGRRSQKSTLTWERYNRLLNRYPLPRPIAIHSIYRRAANP